MIVGMAYTSPAVKAPAVCGFLQLVGGIFFIAILATVVALLALQTWAFAFLAGAELLGGALCFGLSEVIAQLAAINYELLRQRIAPSVAAAPTPAKMMSEL